MSLQFLLILLIAVNSVLTSISQQNNELNGVHLKLAAYTVAPFNVVRMNPDGNLTHSGSTDMLLKWLSERLNFTISFTLFDNEAVIKNGPGTAQIISMVENNQVDGSGVGMIISPDRIAKMDFAYLIWTEPYTILSPLPGEEPRLFAFTWPFQATVWLLTLIVMMTMVVSMALFTKMYTSKIDKVSRKPGSNQQPKLGQPSSTFNIIGVYAIFITNTMTNQGGKDPVDRFSFRLLVGAWLLAAMVLVNSYSGTVISFLTVPRMKPPINTFEDLANSQDVNLILFEDIVITKQIMEAKSGVLKTLGDMTRLNSKLLLRDMVTITTNLQTGKYGFPYLQTFCKFFIVNQFKKESQCRFRISDPLALTGFWAFPLQKNSKYTLVFNLALMEAWQYGLPGLWVKNTIPPAPKCFATLKSQLANQKAIQLYDLLGIFLVLGIGISLSLLIFFTEIIYVKCQQKKSTPH